MFSGHIFGGIVASLGALALLPNFGWKAVVFLAAIPLITLPILIKLMPESYSFLIKVNKKEKLVHTLNRIEKNVQFSEKDEYVIHVSDDNDTSLKKLFTD